MRFGKRLCGYTMRLSRPESEGMPKRVAEAVCTSSFHSRLATPLSMCAAGSKPWDSSSSRTTPISLPWPAVRRTGEAA